MVVKFGVGIDLTSLSGVFKNTPELALNTLIPALLDKFLATPLKKLFLPLISSTLDKLTLSVSKR